MMKIFYGLLLSLLLVSSAFADTHTMSACNQAAFDTAYAAAGENDIVAFPAGTCSITWDGNTKAITTAGIVIQGSGTANTTLKGAANEPIFRVTADWARVTGITFDGNHQNSGTGGLVQMGTTAGTSGCVEAKINGNWRVDHCAFVGCHPSPMPADGVLGWVAIAVGGYSYGVIDNNTFTDCNGECVNISSNGTGNDLVTPAALERAIVYGDYAAGGVVYIEDNTINYNSTCPNANCGGDYGAENFMEGDSGSRYVFRYNTITIAANQRIQALCSNHELYYGGAACNSGTQSDVGSLLQEIYSNTVTNTGDLGDFAHIRAGRSLIYNNTISNAVTSGYIARLGNMRSAHQTADIANPRGYSSYCHEADGAYTVEGMSFSKTTITEALGNDTGCPIVASVADFPTYGGSIIIGTEQIDYTGISTLTLTPCTRGAYGSTRAAHADNSAVNLFIFGVCLEQPNNTWIWGNTAGGVAENDVYLADYTAPDYTPYDIQSYAARPNNWQYRNDGTAYSYTPYSYPHPVRFLTGGSYLGSEMKGVGKVLGVDKDTLKRVP